MRKKFKISNFVFQVDFPDEFEIVNQFKLFYTDESPVYFYTIHYVDLLPVIEGKVIFQDHLLILQTSTGEARYIATKGEKDPYALLVEDRQNHTTVYLLKNHISYLQYDPFFASLFALEKRMIEYNDLVLHCAYMVVGNKAILLSGPSGIGKSTQANLWCKYRGAKIINGDKALIHHKNGKWFASGWPVCGSSKICENSSYPIASIVILTQNRENSAERLDSLQAFKQLYQQITNNIWNSSFNIL